MGLRYVYTDFLTGEFWIYENAPPTDSASVRLFGERALKETSESVSQTQTPMKSLLWTKIGG